MHVFKCYLVILTIIIYFVSYNNCQYASYCYKCNDCKRVKVNSTITQRCDAYSSCETAVIRIKDTDIVNRQCVTNCREGKNILTTTFMITKTCCNTDLCNVKEIEKRTKFHNQSHHHHQHYSKHPKHPHKGSSLTTTIGVNLNRDPVKDASPNAATTTTTKTTIIFTTFLLNLFVLTF